MPENTFLWSSAEVGEFPGRRLLSGALGRSGRCSSAVTQGKHHGPKMQRVRLSGFLTFFYPDKELTVVLANLLEISGPIRAVVSLQCRGKFVECGVSLR